MDNPYQPPETSELVQRSSKKYLETTLLVLFAIFCTLQFWGILFFILDHWNDFGPDTSATAVTLLPSLLRPALLFLSGVLLAFHRKWAVYGLTAYVVTGLLTMPETGRATIVATLFVISLFLMYSIRLLKNGDLR